MANVYFDCEFLEGTQDVRILGINTGIKTKPTIDLISIGMVREDGQEYYAVSKDFNLKEAWNRYDIKTEQVSGDMRNQFPEGIKTKVYWIRENVLKPIWREWVIRSEDEWFAYASEEEYADFLLDVNRGKFDDKFTYKNFKKLLEKNGKSNDQIKKEIIHFCSIRMVEYPSYENEEMIKEEHAHGEEINLYGYYSAYDHVALSWLFGKMIDLPSGFPMYTKDLKQMFDEKQDSYKNNIKSDPKFLMQEIKETGVFFLDGTEYDLKKWPSYPKQSNEHNALSDARWNKNLHEFLKST